MRVEYELLASDLPPDCIAECSASGDVYEACEAWRVQLDFQVNRGRAIRCLNGYGAWDDLESWDDERLARTILWLACCSFREGETCFPLE